MKKRKHLEDDDKDIMMGNTTFKWQWNGQFYKPSGRQVSLKHDDLLNTFPNTLVTMCFFFFFFPCSTMEFCPIFWHKNKGKRKSSSTRVPEPTVCSQMRRMNKWFVWLCRIWRTSPLKVEGPDWQILSKGLRVTFSLPPLKRLGVVVGGICVRGKNHFPLAECKL